MGRNRFQSLVVSPFLKSQEVLGVSPQAPCSDLTTESEGNSPVSIRVIPLCLPEGPCSAPCVYLKLRGCLVKRIEQRKGENKGGERPGPEGETPPGPEGETLCPPLPYLQRLLSQPQAASGPSDAGLGTRRASQQVGDVTAEKAGPGWLPPL